MQCHEGNFAMATIREILQKLILTSKYPEPKPLKIGWEEGVPLIDLSDHGKNSPIWMKLGKMAVFYEKIVQGIVQPDRTGHGRVLQRKSVCCTPVMPLGCCFV